MSDAPESKTDAGTVRYDYRAKSRNGDRRVSDNGCGIKVSTELVTKIVTAIVAALLGSNLYQGVSHNRELTKAQAAWDSDAMADVVARLKRIEGKLP